MAGKITDESISLREILIWITDHSEDEEAMNRISFASFPYTTKYKRHYSRDTEFNDEDNGVFMGNDEHDTD